MEACTVLVHAGTKQELLTKDNAGYTPFQLASDKGHQQIAHFLVCYQTITWILLFIMKFLLSCLDHFQADMTLGVLIFNSLKHNGRITATWEQNFVLGRLKILVMPLFYSVSSSFSWSSSSIQFLQVLHQVIFSVEMAILLGDYVWLIIYCRL